MNSFIVFACALAAASAHYTQLYHGPQHIPVIGKHGVPVDTVEVQHARAAHLAQLAAAQSHGNEYSNHGGEGSVESHDEKYEAPAYHGPQHLAVIGKDGVPVDTKEVQHARAEHFLHKSQAEARAVDHKYMQDESSVANNDYKHEAPVGKIQGHAYSNHFVHIPVESYKGKQHVPVIVKGVPVDTAEVQHARSAHLAAHAAAAAHGHHY